MCEHYNASAAWSDDDLCRDLAGGVKSDGEFAPANHYYQHLLDAARDLLDCGLPHFPYFLNLGQISRGSVVGSDIMTIKEVADYLKITEKTAYRLVAAGDLPGFKVGGSWRFRRSEIDRWIDRQSAKSTGERAG